MNKITLCLLFLVFGLATNTANAATYYVDDANGNDAYDGNSVKPWKTLNRAYTWYSGSGTKVAEGDTVLFKNGNYGMFEEISVSMDTVRHRSNWVTYKNALGHTPILTCIHIKNKYWGSPDIGESRLIFDGFHIIGYADVFEWPPTNPDAFLAEYANYLQILNCDIQQHSVSVSGHYEPYYMPSSCGIRCDSCNDVNVINNVIHNGVKLLYNGGGSRWIVRNNIFHRIAEDGFGISGVVDDVLMEGNYFYDHQPFTTVTQITGTKTGTFIPGEVIVTVPDTGVTGICYRYSSYLEVYPTTKDTFWHEYYDSSGHKTNNFTAVVGTDSHATLTNIIMVDPPHCDCFQRDDTSGPLTNLIIRKNVMDRSRYVDDGTEINGGQGLKLFGYATNGSSISCKVENNLLIAQNYPFMSIGRLIAKINNNTMISWGTSNGSSISNDGGDSTISEFHNNIISKFRVTNSTYTTTFSNRGNNIFREIVAGSEYDANSTDTVVSSDNAFKALFTNYDTNNFNLVLGSLAINFGNATYAPVSDILGHSRGSSPDAGCYEYVGSGDPPHADANDDQTVIASCPSCKADVNLDGSHSTGNIANYAWTWTTKDGNKSATGVKPTVSLPVGRYVITLTVTDDSGNTSTDTLTVTVQLEDGLIKYFKFDEGSGVFANDSSGFGNTGFLINGPTWTAQGEISFDGNNNTVEITTADVNVNRGTIALWAYPNAFSKSKHSLFGHVLSQSNRIQLYCNAAGSLNVGLGDYDAISTNIQNLKAHEWYHIVLVWDQGSYRVYVDGVTRSVGTYAGLSSLQTYADIGNSGNSSARTEGFDGIIDEVRLYNKPLSAAEIADIALVFLPIGDKSTSVGKELSFTVRTKSGLNMDISDNNLPSMPYFASNLFRWTPDYNDSGVYEVEFTAPHGSSTDFEKITISVTNTPSVTPAASSSSWNNGSGDIYYNFNGNLYIWDLSGSYSYKAGEWQLDYTLTQDASGKITGTGTASNSAVNSGAAMPITLKGVISGAAAVKMTLKGTSVKGQIKGTVNGDSKAISGTAKINRQIASFIAPLPANMDGSATLGLSCTSSGNSRFGTGEQTLSNGESFNFGIKGKYNAKYDESTLKLKGIAKGFSLKLKVNGSDGTIKILKGKVLGQKLNATNIAP